MSQIMTSLMDPLVCHLCCKRQDYQPTVVNGMPLCFSCTIICSVCLAPRSKKQTFCRTSPVCRLPVCSDCGVSLLTDPLLPDQASSRCQTCVFMRSKLCIRGCGVQTALHEVTCQDVQCLSVQCVLCGQLKASVRVLGCGCGLCRSCHATTLFTQARKLGDESLSQIRCLLHDPWLRSAASCLANTPPFDWSRTLKVEMYAKETVMRWNLPDETRLMKSVIKAHSVLEDKQTSRYKACLARIVACTVQDVLVGKVRMEFLFGMCLPMFERWFYTAWNVCEAVVYSLNSLAPDTLSHWFFGSQGCVGSIVLCAVLAMKLYAMPLGSFVHGVCAENHFQRVCRFFLSMKRLWNELLQQQGYHLSLRGLLSALMSNSLLDPTTQQICTMRLTGELCATESSSAENKHATMHSRIALRQLLVICSTNKRRRLREPNCYQTNSADLLWSQRTEIADVKVFRVIFNLTYGQTKLAELRDVRFCRTTLEQLRIPTRTEFDCFSNEITKKETGIRKRPREVDEEAETEA